MAQRDTHSTQQVPEGFGRWSKNPEKNPKTPYCRLKPQHSLGEAKIPASRKSDDNQQMTATQTARKRVATLEKRRCVNYDGVIPFS
ncbi:MAG: hypothetical protein ACKODH_03105, partial [Limisphaerales bacterium]